MLIRFPCAEGRYITQMLNFRFIYEGTAVKTTDWGIYAGTLVNHSCHFNCFEDLTWNDDASWNCNPTVEEYYYRRGFTIDLVRPNTPIATEFMQAKQASKETGMRVIRDILAIKYLIWVLGYSAYDILDWHVFCFQQGVVPIVLYNLRNTS